MTHGERFLPSVLELIQANPSEVDRLADPVVVMGAGLAGLATAYYLSGAGRPVVVLEEADVLGGLSRTVVWGDFRFDLGGHRWFTKKEELNAFLYNLMGRELLDVSRASHIYFQGKYFEYPIRIGDILRSMRLTTTGRAVLDYLASRIFSSGMGNNGAASMRDAYIAQFGRTLYELFFEGYSKKVWGYDCDQLSGDWVVQRSRGLSLGTLARASLIRPNSRVASLVGRFKYPRLGIGQISEYMGQAVLSAGGQILLNSKVTEVAHKGHLIESVTYEAEGKRRQLGGSHFVSSIAITELVEILRPPAPTMVREAARTLTYRDHITVNVMLNREAATLDTWIYIHDPQVPFGRIYAPTRWSPYMAPAGKTSLVAEYFCSAGDEIWGTSDDGLCQWTIDSLADKLHFISRADVLGAFVVRTRRAYPVYLLGYDKVLGAIKTYLKHFTNLQVIGRSGTFRYNNMDHSIETGIQAARNIFGEAHDIDAVNSEQEYHEMMSAKRGRG